MKNKLILSIGFPKYVKDKSGMSKVIMAHQKMFNEVGVRYIYLFAVKKMIFNDRGTLFSYFGMYIDGEYEGVYTAKQVLEKLQAWFWEGSQLLNIHIHHMMYMKLKNIEIILSGLPEAYIKIFLHDYYLCCTNYNLMRNGETFCGGLGLARDFCYGCRAFKRSNAEEKKIHHLLNRYKSRLMFIAPSEVTKEIFLKFHQEYDRKVKVIPHQKLIGEYMDNFGAINNKERIKIGFLAMPRKHKGWDTWIKINKLFSKYYDFVVFNSSDEIYDGMEKVKVEFSEEHMDAMVLAMRENNVHLVLLWSVCPETYSYTCFEAYAANAYILTNEISGNIASIVEKRGIGMVFSSEEKLVSFLKEPLKVKEKINEYRDMKHYGPLVLKENDEIVDMANGDTATAIASITRTLPANKLLIMLLDYLLKREII